MEVRVPPPRRKWPPALRRQLLPPFGLVYTAVLTAVLLPASVIFIYAWGWDKPSRGIQVSILKVGALSSNAGPSNLHPMVRLEDAGIDALPRLRMNSKPVPWDELGDVLTNEIKVSPDWIVYVQADENVSWSDVINAMDIIRSKHARIVLLTTKIANLPDNTSGVPLRP
jgi:biopolymer transport protein ExbD